MCGICGIVHLEGEGMDAEPILRQMTAAQKHRGPVCWQTLWGSRSLADLLRCELRDLIQDALAPTRLSQQGIFHPQYVQWLISEHLQGTRDHAHQLWQLLIFQLWLEQNKGDGQGRPVASGSTYVTRQVTSPP